MMNSSSKRKYKPQRQSKASLSLPSSFPATVVTVSTVRRKQYDDQASRHYDRLRIQRELDNFFDCRSVGDYSEELNPVLPSYSHTYRQRSSSSQSIKSSRSGNGRYVLDHIMDPAFDPIADRCDVDAVLEFAPSDDNNDLSHADKPLVPFVEREVQTSELLDLLAIDDDSHHESQDYTCENQVDHPNKENEIQDYEHFRPHPVQVIHQSNSQHQIDQGTVLNQLNYKNLRTTANGEESSAQPINHDIVDGKIRPQHEQDQESVMDGFSILHEETLRREVELPVDPLQHDDNNHHPKEHYQDQQGTSAYKENTVLGQQRRDSNYHSHPPELLMLSMDSSMTQSEDTMLTCKSHLSYDDTPTITPSILFFLNANKQELHNEGLSIANDTSTIHQQQVGGGSIPFSITPKTATSRKLFQSSSSFGVSTGCGEADRDALDIDNESQTAIGYSKGSFSTKYTNDSAKILELRERKRLMERAHEIRYRRFPALIEVEVEKRNH